MGASSGAPTPGDAGSMSLADGSRVAVVGGGHARSLCGYFVLEFAARAGTDVHAVHRMATREQRTTGPRQHPMSLVLRDTFTGSAPYGEILWRTPHPGFWLPLAWHALAPLTARRRRRPAPGPAA